MIRPDGAHPNKNLNGREGPYKVLCRTSGKTYELMDHDGKLLLRKYAASQLKLVSADIQTSQDLRMNDSVHLRIFWETRFESWWIMQEDWRSFMKALVREEGDNERSHRRVVAVRKKSYVKEYEERDAVVMLGSPTRKLEAVSLMLHLNKK
ncbi:hypothetical protein BC829DRAFT_420035 [Chytridium lagenaria]|nr:hypothetical protein BC829DRAFT_420035 [Chytridium lagenaria]